MTDAKLTTEHPDAIVSIRSAEERDDGRCCKVFRRDEKGELKVDSYPEGRTFWFPDSTLAPDFDTMCKALDGLARRRDCCVIRAGLRKPAEYDGRPINRRGTSEVHPWIDTPRNWIALDLDDVEAPANVDPIAWLASVLPAPFTGISFWYQWTASYLVTNDAPNLLRIRLWFRLSRALDCRQCKLLTPLDQWKNTTGTGPNLGLDHGLYKVTQPHYINRPEFAANVADPLPGGRRHGIWMGLAGDEVEVGELHEPTPANRMLFTTPAADDVSLSATESELKDLLRRIEIAAQHVAANARHDAAYAAACDVLAMGPFEAEARWAAHITIRRPGTPWGREENAGEVDGMIRSALTKKASGKLHSSRAPARQAFARVPVPETPVKLAEPIETPPEPETEGKISFGKVALDNSVLLLETLYPKTDTTKGFFRLENQDWIYHDGRYKPAGGETFEGEAQRLMMKEPKIVDAAVKVARRERHKAWKELPMWLDGRERPDPRKLILFENGMVNLDDFAMTRKAELIPHTSEFAAPYRLPYRFDPRATCPLFDQLLESIWPDDAIAREELCKMFGLMLAPITKYQKVFFFEGLPGSGKGTLTRVIQALVGEHNRAALQASSFLERFGLSGCLGKLLATVSEANPDERKDSALPGRAVDLIKSISGEDDVQVDRKGKEPFSGKLFCRFLLSANNAFKALDSSGALHRRLYLFRFEHKPASEDVNLTAKLLEELPGIANRAMEGLYRLTREDGFRAIPSSRDRMHALLRQQSPARNFAVENLRAAQPGDEPVAQGEVQAAFHRWCQSNGIEMNARNYILLDGIRAAGLDPAIITAGPALVHPHLAFVIPSTAASLME